MSYFEDWMNARHLSVEDINRIRDGAFDYDINEPFLGEYMFLERLHEQFEKGSVITICPDYDADGIMAGTIFYVGLAELGFEHVNCYYPVQDTGYGLTEVSAEALLAEFPDTEVVVTCDNGIHSDLAVEYFKKRKIPVLVTDHHPSVTKPDADACVDPSYVEDEYPFKGISGATVLWKLLCRYAMKYAPDKFGNIYSLSVFAGISAVTDSMPMAEENRFLVRLAVSTIGSLWQRSGYGTEFPSSMLRGFCEKTIRAFEGLYGLLKTVYDYGGRPGEADETFFGFTIGPMLNSARRVDLDSSAAFDVFIGDMDPYTAAENLYFLNQTRKGIVGPLSDQAVFNSDRELTTGHLDNVSALSCAFCYGAEGCLGLVSSVLSGHTGYPSVCFALSDENYRGQHEGVFIADNTNILSCITSEFVKGSARAPGWFDFYAFANWFDQIYPGSIRFGGHGQAGSFSVLTTYLGIFSHALLTFAHNISEGLSEEEVIPPYDLCVAMGCASDNQQTIVLDPSHFAEWVEFSGQLDELKPFGEGFPKPCFRVAVDISSKDVAVQYLSGGKHLKCSFDQFDVILWNCGEAFSREMPSLLFADTTLGINEFRGNLTVTFYANSYFTVNTEYTDGVFSLDINQLF